MKRNKKSPLGLRNTLIKHFSDNQKKDYQKYLKHGIPPDVKRIF